MTTSEAANERGREAMAAGKFDDAYSEFSKAIEAAGDSQAAVFAKYYANRAAASLALRNFIEGVKFPTFYCFPLFTTPHQ